MFLELGEVREAAGARLKELSLAFALSIMEAIRGLRVEEGHDLVGGWGTDYRGQGGSRKTSWEAITTVLVSQVVA